MKAKIKGFAKGHKVITGLIILVAVFTGYKIIKSSSSTAGETKYVVATVQKGAVVATVSGTGQVSATSQTDVKSKTSGDVVGVYVKSGDYVSAGQALAQLDDTDAKNALASAQIDLQKTEDQSGDTSSYYDGALTDVTNTFLQIPDVINGLKSIFDVNTGYLAPLNVNYISSTAITYTNSALTSFGIADNKYEALVTQYKNVSRSSSDADIQNLVNSTYDMLKSITQALKDTKTAVDYIRSTVSSNNTIATQGNTAEANITTWTNQMNGQLSSILSDRNNFNSNVLSLQSAQLALQLKQEALDDTTVTSPFSGIVGKVDIKTGDNIGSGSVVATVISKEQEADVSLNEVDAVKVKQGDKATMTFDAVDGLTLTGTVSDIDLVGTVSQGVVTYNAKIIFDTSDDRVRSGMSANASIIVDSKQDVISVPTSAVKSDSQGSYVLVFNPPLPSTGGSVGVASTIAPTPVSVETGLSSDTSVEITSGLNVGDQVVTRTILPTTTTSATASAPSLFGGGAARGGTGAVRIGR